MVPNDTDDTMVPIPDGTYLITMVSYDTDDTYCITIIPDDSDDTLLHYHGHGTRLMGELLYIAL